MNGHALRSCCTPKINRVTTGKDVVAYSKFAWLKSYCCCSIIEANNNPKNGQIIIAVFVD